MLYLLLIPALLLLTQSFSSIAFADNAYSNTIQQTVNELVFELPIEKQSYDISSEYGKRNHPIKKIEIMHNGIDLRATKGTPVKASETGIVVKQEFNKNGYGKVIVIQHPNGFYTLYAQLSAMHTQIGKKVTKGETIGLVGSSGQSTGPHLHFEIKKDGDYLNPAGLIQF